MNDEDDEFVDLFGDVCYIDGGNQSGFYLVEEQVFETRFVMYLSKTIVLLR